MHGGAQAAVFQGNQWNRTLPNVTIFDDVFVDENIYSGLVVGAGHRQNLHELILGAQGVALTQQLDGLMQQIESHNSDLRTKAAAIPEGIRGGLTVDGFCALPPRSDIDEAIVSAERALAAAQEEDQVRNAHTFDTFSLPEMDQASIEEVLARDLPALDAAAAARVEAHVATLGGQSDLGSRTESIGSSLARAPDGAHPHSHSRILRCHNRAPRQALPGAAR